MDTARPATEADVDLLVALGDRARDQVVEGRGGPLFLAREMVVPGGRRESLLEAVHSAAHRVVVGEFDGAVVGYGLAVIEPLADGTRLAVVEHLVVEPEFREVGVGEAMMNLLIDEARAAGCAGIDSWALPGDRQTKNFFESFGLKARLLLVHRSFADEE
ncbi:MAG: GNAT family N-acetyltransferase [Acidimicrobiales bacterium]